MALYKYVTIERFDILKYGHIRFTPPAAFNDPFELFPYIESIAPEKDIEEYILKHEWDEWLKLIRCWRNLGKKN